MTDTYDPADYTVDQVNEFLDAHPDQTDAVLKAEADGKGRVGITEGPHAASEPTDGPEAQDTDADASQDLLEATQDQGFHGTIPSQADDTDDALKAKPVEDAAADQDVADVEDSYFGALPEPDDTTAPVALPDLEPQPSNLAETEDAQKGYFGTLPDADDRPDLTLAAAAQRAQEQYGDNTPEQ